jgi:hypothetical protein
MRLSLVAYATTDGHTRTVTKHVAAALAPMSPWVELLDAAAPAASSVSLTGTNLNAGLNSTVLRPGAVRVTGGRPRVVFR